VIATNTTISRDGLHSTAEEVESIGAGGLSGPILRDRSLEVLRLLRQRLGEGTLIISVGGISTAADAWDRIRAGATLVQAYTAFVYGGPLWPSRVQRGIARRARLSGFATAQQAVGTEVRAR
jgi:dihydroorotate dehydrogenase